MKWSMGNPSSHVTMQRRHVTPKGQNRDYNMIRAQCIRKQLEMQFSNNR